MLPRRAELGLAARLYREGDRSLSVKLTDASESAYDITTRGTMAPMDAEFSSALGLTAMVPVGTQVKPSPA